MRIGDLEEEDIIKRKALGGTSSAKEVFEFEAVGSVELLGRDL